MAKKTTNNKKIDSTKQRI